MAHCGVDSTMYGKVEACNFLCHPYAKNLLMLTVEVSQRATLAAPFCTLTK